MSTYVLAPILRKAIFRNEENTGRSIENKHNHPTDAEIIATLKTAGLLTLTGTVAPTDVTPVYAGQFYVDITANKAYFSAGPAKEDWVELGLTA